MPNNDYILRSDALKAVCENCSMHGDEGEPCSSRCEDYALVLKIPAADVEPVTHGYWYFRGGRPCCSICHTKALWEDEGGTGGFSHEYVGAKSKWCPECGAKMDKEDSDAGNGHRDRRKGKSDV